MTREEIDAMLVEAVRDAVRDGATGIRYHFAALIEQRAAAAEREACAKRCERVADDYIAANGRHAAAIAYECAVAIRARGEKS